MSAKDTKNTKKDKNWDKIRAEADVASENEKKKAHVDEESVSPEESDSLEPELGDGGADSTDADNEADVSGEAQTAPEPEEAKKTAKQLEELENKYLHVMAEYDNYRRRAQKERESAYTDAYADALKEILPIADNIERAATYTDGEKVLEGVQMVLKQVDATLEKLGVEAFGAEGDTFDPNIHNAVMHEENPDLGENVITGVFQKGYRKGDRIIRFAMVRVAN